MTNPYKEASPPLRTDKLIDLAFRRAFKRKHSVKGSNIVEIAREREIARIRSMTDTVVSRLLNVVKSFPTVDNLHPFYKELAHVLVDVDKLRKSLAAAQWAAQTISRVSKVYIRRIARSDDPDVMAKLRKEFTGRFSSILKQVSENIDYLAGSVNTLKDLPDIDTNLPTVVLAGMPNTGKSTIIRHLSSAEPEIAPYPFTTKGLVVGHSEFPGVGKVQFIDTPGLLDRPLAKRNWIERQAILALRYLGRLIVYVFDPTETCGYTVESQLSLYREILEEFEVSVVKVANKSDISELFYKKLHKIVREAGDVIEMSAELGEGVDELRRAIWRELRK